MDVYGSDIHKSPKGETTQMSLWRQMDKLNIIYPYSEILFSYKRNEILMHAITWKNLENMLSERSQSSPNSHITTLHYITASTQKSRVGKSTEKENMLWLFGIGEWWRMQVAKITKFIGF